MNTYFSGPCPACGAISFSNVAVLWKELIEAWQLTDREVAYINRQQGFHCDECGNNLRTMALSQAILDEYGFDGTLAQFCVSTNGIDVLEINTAGQLSAILKSLPNHRLVEYPEYDMMELKLDDEQFDLVIHSDTLEHIAFPERGLSECRRVLRKDGKCIFTVPVIVDRFTRSREGLKPAYHGQSGVPANDQVVWTEFGADVWKAVIKAGFKKCKIFSFEYPAAIVLIAQK